MATHLVTGYAGRTHVTAMNGGAFNAGVVGPGEYVFNTGNKFEASVISNNEIKILDGDGIMQGRHFTLDADTYESITIANGLTGLNRNDLIVARYEKSETTGVETVSLAVIQGTSTDGTPNDPECVTGNILTGCTLHEMPLYRVPISGLNIGALECLFETVDSINSLKEKVNSVEESVADLSTNVSTWLPLTTIATGETTVTITSDKITTSSIIDIYYSDTTISVAETVEYGSLTITLDSALEADLTIRCKVVNL